MRTQHRFLIIIFSLLVSFPAIASDWVQVYSDKEFTVYIDKQSISGEPPNREFWEKLVFKEIQSVSGKYYSYIKAYLEMNCTNNISKVHELIFYASDEKVISRETFSPPSTLRIVPDSIAEIEKHYICSFEQMTHQIAPDWVEIYSTEDFTVYVDKQSIKRDASSVKFWERMVDKKEQKLSDSDKYYISTIQYLEIDCNNNILKLHYTIFYASDGEAIAQGAHSPPRVHGIAPDTGLGLIKKYVCSFKQTK